MVTPEGYEKWNPALRGAWRKGWEAAEARKTLAACPYKDKRKVDGRLTWSRAFASAWRDGWDAQRQFDPITAHYADRMNSGQSPLEARP